MKKIIALLLAVVMCVGVFAACGKTETADTAKPSTDAAATPAPEKTEEPTATPEADISAPDDEAVGLIRTPHIDADSVR